MLSHDDGTTNQHWHNQSENFSGGDSLLTALARGWQMSDVVLRQQHNYSGRSVMVYHILLQRCREKSVMCVISNPFVERFIQNSNCTILSYTDQHSIPSHSYLEKIAS